jgi:hypothetical protein
VLLYVALGVVFLLLANTSFVFYLFMQNQFRHLWTLRILRLIAGLELVSSFSSLSMLLEIINLSHEETRFEILNKFVLSMSSLLFRYFL